MPVAQVSAASHLNQWSVFGIDARPGRFSTT